MVLIDSASFFKLTQHFEVVPYTQSRGMYEFHAVSGIDRILFFVDSTDQPSMACFGHEKTFFGKKMILIEGECYANPNMLTKNIVRDFYREMTLQGYDIIEICSNSEYLFEYESSLRQAGYLRPVGQFSMPVTKIIDLTSEIKYNQNWKRNIKKSTQYNLSLEPIEYPSMVDCENFIDIYIEMNARKSLSESFSKKNIFKLCNSENFKLFFVRINESRICSMIIHQRKTHAGLLYAATNKEALRTSASFFMYNEIFKYLRHNNFTSFDMEKLVPSTKPINSVFLFKNGVNGTHQQLNGEWSWYKRTYYRPLMYFVKKYLMKKREL